MRGRVVVVGALHLDRRFEVAALPGPGETVHSSGTTVGPGGKGLNQAVAAASAGAPTVMVGAVGQDPEADMVLATLSNRGVDSTRVARVHGSATGGAVVLVDVAAENSIVISSGANAVLQPAEVVAAMGSVTAEDIVLLQNELPGAVSQAVAARARSGHARIVWNAAPAPAGYDEVIEHADVLLCNEHECARISDLLGLPRGDLNTAALAVSNRLGTAVVCTLGSAGAVIADMSGVLQVSAPAVQAVDTTGAGDTFAGYLVAGLLGGLGIDSAAIIAASAAALAVTHAGAAGAVPTNEDVQAFIGRNDQIGERAS